MFVSSRIACVVSEQRPTKSSPLDAAGFSGDLDLRFLETLGGGAGGWAAGSLSFLGGAGTCLTFLPPKKSLAATGTSLGAAGAGFAGEVEELLPLAGGLRARDALRASVGLEPRKAGFEVTSWPRLGRPRLRDGTEG